jgi:hypothetical protein
LFLFLALNGLTFRGFNKRPGLAWDTQGHLGIYVGGILLSLTISDQFRQQAV